MGISLNVLNMMIHNPICVINFNNFYVETIMSTFLPIYISRMVNTFLKFDIKFHSLNVYRIVKVH